MNFSRTYCAATPDLTTVLSDVLQTHTVQRALLEYEAGRGSGDGDVAKHRIGAGYIGEPCDRALAYRYHKAPKEERKSTVSSGELFRHAAAGFWTEGAVADWFRCAGFDLLTEKDDGSQYGFKAAADPSSGQYRLAGEIDGLFLSAPAEVACLGIFPTPCLWESKKATHKKCTKFRKQGVAKADPKYHGQMQTNMAYLEVGHTLFTMLDLDNMKFYIEMVAFDPVAAQRLTDRALRVFDTREPEEMPRIAREASDFRCKFCDYAGRCWEPAAPTGRAVDKPTWLMGT